MIHFFPPRRPDGAGVVSPHRLDPPRWSALCKAAAAVAVGDGHITEREACELCGMEAQELEVWRHVVRDHGLRRMFAGRI